MVGLPHLEEDIGARPVEAVGPGVERGHKRATFQGTAPGTGLLFAFPASHGALAVGGEGHPEWWAGLQGQVAPQGALGQQSWLPLLTP